MSISHKGLAELKRVRAAGNRLLGAVFLFSVFVNLLMLVGPLFMLQVYDRVLGSRSEETLAALFILMAVLYALMGVLDYARGRVLARFGAQFQNTLDARVFDAEMQLALSSKRGAAPATGLADLDRIQALFASPAMLALFDAPWTPFFLAVLFIFHPLMGWFAVAGGLILVVVTLLNNLLTRERVAKAQIASAQSHSMAEQTRSAAGLVRAQGMRRAMTSRWQKVRTGALDQSVETSDWIGLFSALTKSFRLFLQSAMLGLGAYLTLQGEITAGAMIAGSILLGRALAPVEQAIGQWPSVQRARQAWASLGDLLNETTPEATHISLPRPVASVGLKNVFVRAEGVHEPILTSVTFELPPSQVLGIIGKSGSGKSTLAKTIVGLVKPAAGEVRLGGATLDQYALDDLGQHIGYLPQEVSLFSGTVAENIARMSEQPDQDKAIAAAKMANAHEMILALPQGYQTVVHGRNSQLSGGQRQRIALARALYDDPVLLVLDEPNSALDSEGSLALNAAVRAFKRSDRAVIIMTHRPAAISECDRLLVIDQGRIRADGPRDEILERVLKNASGVQQEIKGTMQ